MRAFKVELSWCGGEGGRMAQHLVVSSSVLLACVLLSASWWWWRCRRCRCRCKGRKMVEMMASSRGGDVVGRIPKGSLGWPLLGETLEFIACGSKPLDFLHKRRLLYGKVFRSHLLGRPIIISTDAEVNKVILQNDGRLFIPSYPKSVTELLGNSSILQMNGNLHKRVHGLVGGFLKSHSLKQRIAKHVENLVQLSFVSWKEGRQIYVQDETKEITFRVLVKVLLSIDPGQELQFLKAQFEEFIKGLICLPIKLPGTRLYKSLKAKEKIMKLIKKIIDDKLQSGTPGVAMDVVDVLLKEMNDGTKQQKLTEMNDGTKQQKLTTDFICANIMEMMIPGEDTVPMLITLALKYLSDSPTALKHLMEENMELKRKKQHLNEAYTWTDYMSLSFTQNVISETLRMGNIINAVWRKSLADVEIKGYLIPKNWCVLTSFTSIHLDHENYENPFEFDPWRWRQKREGSNQSTFTPFGGGQRLCPGLELSRLEVAIFLHHFATRFRWFAEDDMIITFPTVKMKKRLPVTLSPI